jgi:phenylalanyl-tRNA synthetase alpha chain
MLDISRLTQKQQQFLILLQTESLIPSLHQFSIYHGLDFNFAKGFVLSGLLADYVEVEELTETQWVLTSKGEASDRTIPGFKLVEQLSQGIALVEPLQTILGASFSVDYGALRREQVVDMQGEGASKTIVVLLPELLTQFQQRQITFAVVRAGQPTGDRDGLAWLEAQSLIRQEVRQDYGIRAKPTLQSLEIRPIITRLTRDLLLSGQWREVEFKPYNLDDEVPDIAYGQASILTQCIQRIRDIFLHMGFDEMAGTIVESAFWNFDALFTPQDHPAREVQDTFYLAQPSRLPLPEDPALIAQIQQVHQQSYGGKWTEAEASRAILRAHTTPFTARKLYQLQGKQGKFFSIDKVFRNENVDRTHLAEFHQIEGVVIGELLSVRSLISYLTYFYQQLGFKHLKFKPTYNPYTEPSLEVLAYHSPSGRYLEVGNSGLFRAEMLKPLGCEGVSTVAWGLGLERIALLLYDDVEKLSDLVGPDICLHASPKSASTSTGGEETSSKFYR